MGGGASTANSDEEIKHFIRKDLSRARKLMHEVTNEKCPVLFSSHTPDKEDFRRMLKVPGMEYDHATAGADELVEIIGKLKERYPDGHGIALACHGPSSGNSGQFEWSISQKIIVKSVDDVKEGTPAFRVLSALGDAVGDGNTVDLFACELLKTDAGKAVFKAVEVATKCNFAASSDLTGNPANGGDWVMESDGVNVKDVYFKETDEFTGTFGPGGDALTDENAAFKAFDKDNSGKITADEIRLSMKGSNITDEEINEMIGEADTDHDGKINWEEFAKMMMSK